jgi:hypothetical protein
MSRFKKLASSSVKTKTRLCFLVRVNYCFGDVRYFAVRYCYLTTFIHSVMKSVVADDVVVMQMFHRELPVTSFYSEELPF